MKISWILIAIVGVVVLAPLVAPQAQENVTSTATVTLSLSIGISTALQDGINFGNLNPGTDNNSDPDNVNNTVNVSGNTNIDLCIRANGSMNSSLYEITLGNYSWDGDISFGALAADQNTMSTTFAKDPDTNNLPSGTQRQLGFWLDVPSGQPAGTYVNEIHIRAVQSGAACE